VVEEDLASRDVRSAGGILLVRDAASKVGSPAI
jgi:hypothetical protein